MTGILRVPIECAMCGVMVEPASALLLPGKEKKYGCYGCYKSTQERTKQKESEGKISYLCDRCHYKFKSHTASCPYCNKGDKVRSAVVTVHDLL